MSDPLDTPPRPFRPGVGRPLLVHCSHHKAGTEWFRRVLRALAKSCALPFERCRGGPVGPDTGIAFFRAAQLYHREALSNRVFRGSHMIRDPRDVVVSGYHYHLWTEEKWAHIPGEPAWGGMSYQEFLNSVDRHQGLLAEIERSSGKALADMAAWDYGQPEFLELRYEDVIADEVTWFTRLFEFYGLDEEAVDAGLVAVEKFSIHARPVPVGTAGEKRHVRSGKPGQWREQFGPDHVERFKALTGDLLVRLGYEADQNWSAGTPDADTGVGRDV
jgi:hypothetical protein